MICYGKMQGFYHGFLGFYCTHKKNLVLAYKAKMDKISKLAFSYTKHRRHFLFPDQINSSPITAGEAQEMFLVSHITHTLAPGREGGNCFQIATAGNALNVPFCRSSGWDELG